MSDPAARRYAEPAPGAPEIELPRGDVAGDPPGPGYAALLESVARLLRRLHDASAGFPLAAPAGSVWGHDTVRVDWPDPPPETVSQNDVTPQNVVVRDGEAAGLLDFDLAGPVPRLADVWNTTMWWCPLHPPADVWPGWPTDPAPRLRAFADAYGLTPAERAALVPLGISRTERARLRMAAAAEQLGGGWRRMWDAGVGDRIARRRAWLEGAEPALTSALLDR